MISIPVSKAKTIRSKFYKNVVIKQQKKYYSRCPPKTGTKYLQRFHVKGHVDKTRIEIQYLEAKKGTVLPSPPLFLNIQPCVASFCSSNLNSIYLEKHIILGVQFSSIYWVSLLRNLKNFPDVYLSSKNVKYGNFQGQDRIKSSKFIKCV